MASWWVGGWGRHMYCLPCRSCTLYPSLLAVTACLLPLLGSRLTPAPASTATHCVPLTRPPAQVGTGVMVGLPGQTLRDLAGDLLFFRDLGADMIGMVRPAGRSAVGQTICVHWVVPAHDCRWQLAAYPAIHQLPSPPPPNPHTPPTPRRALTSPRRAPPWPTCGMPSTGTCPTRRPT